MRVQQTVFVPAVFHLPHQLIGFLPILQRDKLSAQTSVTMFAADSAAMFANEECCLAGNVAEECSAFFSF